MRELDKRGLVLGLAGATLLAALLRLPFLDHQSLWYDETFTRAIASEPGPGGVIDAVEETESTPPVFYLLTWLAAELFGTGEAALRVVSGLAGVASAPVAFFALRRYVGARAGIVSAWLVAASPLLVWYSLDARAYALFVLTGLLSLWTLALVLEEPTRRNWIAWVAAGALCFWTHYFAAFFLAAQIGVLVWKRAAPVRSVALWSTGLAAASAVMLPLLFAQKDSRADWITSASLGDRFEGLARQYAMGPNVPWAWLEALGIALALGALAAGAWFAWRDGIHEVGILAVIAAATIGVPLLLNLTDIDNHFLLRNVMVAWPCLAGIAAMSLKRLHAIPLAAYIVLAVVAQVAIQSDWRYQNADWRGAVEELPDDAAGVPVIAYPGLESVIPGVYLNREPTLRPVEAETVWVMVEPRRTDDRELEPVERTPPNGVPGFMFAREREHRGFRLLEFRALLPALADPQQAGPDYRGEPPRLLAP